MAKLTADEIERHAAKIVDLFSDGFQIDDLFKIIPMAMGVVEQVGGMSGPEKKETAIAILNLAIDKTDIPWLPDALVDPLLKRLVPPAIEMVISATNGETDVNKT